MSRIEPQSVALEVGVATIRTTEAADAGAINALRVAIAHETEFLMREADEIRIDVPEQSAFLARKAASPVDLFIHAEVEARIVGIAALEGSPFRRFEHAATLALAVSREFWGRGVGRALMHALIGWADSRGLVRIALEVVETNTRAIRLYESLGFEHEGRLRCSRRHGGVFLDNLQMARIRVPSVAP